MITCFTTQKPQKKAGCNLKRHLSNCKTNPLKISQHLTASQLRCKFLSCSHLIADSLPYLQYLQYLQLLDYNIQWNQLASISSYHQNYSIMKFFLSDTMHAKKRAVHAARPGYNKK